MKHVETLSRQDTKIEGEDFRGEVDAISKFPSSTSNLTILLLPPSYSIKSVSRKQSMALSTRVNQFLSSMYSIVLVEAMKNVFDIADIDITPLIWFVWIIQNEMLRKNYYTLEHVF